MTPRSHCLAASVLLLSLSDCTNSSSLHLSKELAVLVALSTNTEPALVALCAALLPALVSQHFSTVQQG
jgi:hypothetical protein